MTVEEVQQLKPGVLLTTYNKGYFRFVKATPCRIDHTNYITQAFKLVHGDKEWKVGDIYQYIVYYTLAYTPDFKYRNGKAISGCSSRYCTKVTLSSEIPKRIKALKEQLSKTIEEYNSQITKLQELNEKLNSD